MRVFWLNYSNYTPFGIKEESVNCMTLYIFNKIILTVKFKYNLWNANYVVRSDIFYIKIMYYYRLKNIDYLDELLCIKLIANLLYLNMLYSRQYISGLLYSAISKGVWKAQGHLAKRHLASKFLQVISCKEAFWQRSILANGHFCK